MQLAFRKTESNFRPTARTQRKYFLGVIPSGRISTNFIGWYINKTNKLLGISKNNAYLQYLAYHQGQAGFKTGAYKTKKALLEVAKKTALSKKIFDRQLKKCM